MGKSLKIVALVTGGKDSCYSMIQCVAKGRALAQCPTQFSVSAENCLCGLGKQSGRVAKMAFISTGEISGSAGEGSIIKY